MTPKPPLTDQQEESTPSTFPIRFSMRTMLIAMTVLAVWCTAVAVLPLGFSQMAIGLIWFVLVSWLAAGILFSQGDRRAFCLGALIVITSMWTGVGGQFMDGFYRLTGSPFGLPWNIWIDHGLIALTAAANGWVCVQARRYFQRHSDG